MENVFREVKQAPEFYDATCLDFPAHIHEDIELIYTRRGGGIAYCDGRSFLLEPGSFFLVFPNQVHYYTDSGQSDYILLVIKPSSLSLGEALFLTGYPTSPLQQISDHPDDHVRTLIELALDEYKRNGHSTVSEAYLSALFEKLLTYYTIEKGTVSGNTVLRIMQYCSEHYKEDISVNMVAQELGISRSTVSHIFNDRLGVSFCDHINSLRLMDAVRLLKNQSYSVTDVAAIAGFATIRTFNRVFQKQYSISPTEYRRRQRTSGEE